MKAKVGDKTCVTCRHYDQRANDPTDWCPHWQVPLVPGNRGCPAWEAKARHWSEEAAGLIALHGRFDKPEGTMARWIREAHDAACRVPDYGAMARAMLYRFPSLERDKITFPDLLEVLREADKGR